MSVKKIQDVIIRSHGNYFEIEYEDHTYTNRLVECDLLKVQTQSGVYWMFVVKNEDFMDRKEAYIQAVEDIQKRIIEHLVEEHGFKKRTIFLIDHITSLGDVIGFLI